MGVFLYVPFFLHLVQPYEAGFVSQAEGTVENGSVQPDLISFCGLLSSRTHYNIFQKHFLFFFFLLIKMLLHYLSCSTLLDCACTVYQWLTTKHNIQH